MLETLKKRGACFASALSAQLKGKSALEPLLHLAHKGLVRSDSLTPLRVEEEVLLPGKTDGRRLAAARARALSRGSLGAGSSGTPADGRRGAEPCL